MRNRRAFWVALTLIFLSAGSGYSRNWQLVWHDEFDGKIGPDWVFETGRGSNGWGNNELQYYRRENAKVENGALVITAKREPFDGANYTSVRMKTQGRQSWKYGKIEARIAMPSFQGAWPAFWMLGDSIAKAGWPACGEIDIMEHVNTGGGVFGSAHWTAPDGSKADYTRKTTTDVTKYHIYAVEWTPTEIQWLVDGVPHNKIDIAGGKGGMGEFGAKFFVLLNLAIGGNWPGAKVDDKALPAKMRVDYVRVYQDKARP